MIAKLETGMKCIPIRTPPIIIHIHLPSDPRPSHWRACAGTSPFLDCAHCRCLDQFWERRCGHWVSKNHILEALPESTINLNRRDGARQAATNTHTCSCVQQAVSGQVE